MGTLQRSVIAIMGTTGVGKSQLAVDLALRINTARGQRVNVLNADAMQTYAGLDIITNKISRDEMRGVEHLMMGFKRPGEEYVVGEWVQDALHLISHSHSQGTLPIVVGGTSYWIQNLLLPSRLPSLDEGTLGGKNEAKKPASPSPSLAASLSKLPPELLSLYNDFSLDTPSAASDPDLCLSLYTLLCLLDPPMGARWHWRDSRKVVRSLRIIRENGRRASEVLAEQQAAGTSQPRFRTLIFWLYAAPHVLDPRLSSRVDDMLQKGLLDEILALRRLAATIYPTKDGRIETDYTEGIFQAIGYKEFDEYLSAAEPLRALFDSAVAAMKQGTKKYAQRQVKWMKHKLLPAVAAAKAAGGNIDVYLLDATDLSDWDTAVKDVAIDLSTTFLQGDALPEPTSLSELARDMLGSTEEASPPLATLEKRRKRSCDVCTEDTRRPVMIEEGANWEVHVKSRSHRRMQRRLSRPDVHARRGESAQQDQMRRSPSSDGIEDAGGLFGDD